jgi:hypothetical protein
VNRLGGRVCSAVELGVRASAAAPAARSDQREQWPLAFLVSYGEPTDWMNRACVLLTEEDRYPL